jgi:hypothetical protein
MADSDLGFSIEGWDEFVENFSEFVDKWEAKKAILLKRMGTIYQAAIIPYVPTDTSTLAYSISVFTDGIPQDYVEVGTNIEYALYVNDGHVQHSRLVPVEKIRTGGKSKTYHTINTKKGMCVTLRERYIPGVHFMEKGWNDAKPRLERLVNSFMESCAREVEGGRK